MQSFCKYLAPGIRITRFLHCLDFIESLQNLVQRHCNNKLFASFFQRKEKQSLQVHLFAARLTDRCFNIIRKGFAANKFKSSSLNPLRRIPEEKQMEALHLFKEAGFKREKLLTKVANFKNTQEVSRKLRKEVRREERCICCYELLIVYIVPFPAH